MLVWHWTPSICADDFPKSLKAGLHFLKAGIHKDIRCIHQEALIKLFSIRSKKQQERRAPPAAPSPMGKGSSGGCSHHGLLPPRASAARTGNVWGVLKPSLSIFASYVISTPTTVTKFWASCSISQGKFPKQPFDSRTSPIPFLNLSIRGSSSKYAQKNTL